MYFSVTTSLWYSDYITVRRTPMPTEMPAIFSLDELWVLQRYVRHECPDREKWKFPPASLELNEQVTDAIRFCAETGTEDAALLLSKGDCLLLDMVVPQDAKTTKGVLAGPSILLRAYGVRHALTEDTETTPEPEGQDVSQTKERLRDWIDAQEQIHEIRERLRTKAQKGA